MNSNVVFLKPNSGSRLPPSGRNIYYSYNIIIFFVVSEFFLE